MARNTVNPGFGFFRHDFMNLPNRLSLLRILMVPFFLVILLGGFIEPFWAGIAATAVFAVASATDFLDGYIARSRGLITTLGKFMDPLADKLLVCSALIALSSVGALPAWVTILIVSRELIVTGFRLAAVERGIVLAASKAGKLKTVFQMAMVIFLLLPLKGNMPVVPYDCISWGLIILTSALTVWSLAEYIFKNISVLKE